MERWKSTRTVSLSRKFDASTAFDSSASAADFIALLVGPPDYPTTLPRVMDDYSRQIFAKVEITYTDPFKDETLVITLPETARFTSEKFLSDGILSPTYKWFSLHDNKLDGSYHPLPSNANYSVGWWGKELSNSSGVFTNPQVITIEFSPRTLTEVQLVGDDLLECYPVDFTYALYDADNNLQHSIVVEDNASPYWKSGVPELLDTVKAVITINKVSKGNSSLKLLELMTAIIQTYENDMLESIHILEEIGYATGSVPLGNISSNEVDITISNADRRFDLDNENSTIHGFVKRNRKVRVWLGAEVNGEVEWAPMGTYWTTSWDIRDDSLSVTLTARDRLELLRLTFMRAPIFQNKSLYYLFDYVLRYAGLTVEEFELDPALEDVTIPYAWLDNITHRDALARLARCGVVQVYCTRDGVIRVNKDLDAPAETSHVFDEKVNVYSSRNPLAVAEQVNHVEVVHQQWAPVAGTEVYDSQESFTIPAGTTYSHIVEFSRSPVLSINPPSITATGTVTLEGYTLYATGVELRLKNTTGSAITVSAITITGTVLEEQSRGTIVAKDDSAILQDGKISVSISDSLIQSQAYATELASQILQAYKDSRLDITIENRGNVASELGSRVAFRKVKGSETYYMVTRQSMTWAGYLEATTEGKKL